MRRLLNRKAKKSRGQALVELALFFPILIILISGVIEFGIFLNEYLSVLDAARNAARFASDGLYYQDDGVMNCSSTNFYRQTACVVNDELVQEQPWIAMARGDAYGSTPDCSCEEGDPGYPACMLDPCCSDPYCSHLDPRRGDDIVISVFSVADSVVQARYPDGDGFSYAEDWGVGTAKVSKFSTSDINSMLTDPLSPNTGYILVEIYYNYDQYLDLPWVDLAIDGTVETHSYAFMPLSSAEPTPTPLP